MRTGYYKHYLTGAPALLDKKIVGLTSFEYPGEFRQKSKVPEMYTRLDFHYDWILANTENDADFIREMTEGEEVDESIEEAVDDLELGTDLFDQDETDL